MRLEIRKIIINDVILSVVNKIEDDVLFINVEQVKSIIMEDNRIKSVIVDIAKPNESVRIIPVKDVIEPRAKLNGEIFPGTFNQEIEEGGYGVTYVLSGCAIVTTGPIVGFQEGLIDMSGPAAQYSIFSKLINIVLNITKEESVTPHEHEEAVRLAGIKVAKFVGEIGLGYNKFQSENHEWNSIISKASKYPGLPKIVYIYNCMSQGLLHDTYFYGRDSKLMLPTIINPLEVMDGAIVSGNCVSPGSKTTTYHHQNNSVIKECLIRDGKEINFIGIILNPLMTTLKEKFRNCMITSHNVEMLGADGAVISQEGFGNPTTDLMIICKKLENRGVKTVIITNEDAGLDGMSESLPDSLVEANAIISTGNSNEILLLPKMNKIIGNIEEVSRLTGGNVNSIKDDGKLEIEIHSIMGSHNLQGNTFLSAVTI